jgi:hypothetical protein
VNDKEEKTSVKKIHELGNFEKEMLTQCFALKSWSISMNDQSFLDWSLEIGLCEIFCLLNL